MPFTLELENAEATDRLGEDLARALKKGDVLALSGEIGAGKSTLARALIRSRELPASLRRVRTSLGDHPSVARSRAPPRPLPANQLAVAAVDGSTWRRIFAQVAGDM